MISAGTIHAFLQLFPTEAAMKKTAIRRLSLHRDTLTRLDGYRLAGAAGPGGPTRLLTICIHTCDGCPPPLDPTTDCV